jgi:predicted transcriptional regulator
MTGDISVFIWKFMIFAVISFTVGAVSMIMYNILKKMFRVSNLCTDKDIIDAIVAEYTYRLKNLEKTIAELRVKTDTMEMRISQQPASQTPFITSTSVTTDLGKEASQHQSQVEYPPTSSVSETGVIMQLSALPATKTNGDVYNNTMDYILKLLIERPRTSREIQHAIRRTREHTSRLMKKLYQANLVSRDNNSKPFKYSISDAGRIQLKEHQKTSAAAVADGMQALVDVPESQLQTTV